MKYIKLFEKRIIGYIYPIGKSWEPLVGWSGENETIEEVYEYLYNLGAEPKILKKPTNYIYFKYRNIGFNNEIPSFIKNRSEAVRDTDDIVIDEEKEKEMELYLTAKQYNI